MKAASLRIATGAEQHLRVATEDRARAKYERELAAASNWRQRAAIRKKIRQEIKEEMKRVASPYSLWAAQ